MMRRFILTLEILFVSLFFLGGSFPETETARNPSGGFSWKDYRTIAHALGGMDGKDYLNSSWTDQLHQDRRLHIIYLAVDPEMQHHGIAATLVEEAVAYAERNDLMISLETHNPRNVAFYQQFGFKVYGVVEKHFSLKQYCLVREIQA